LCHLQITLDGRVVTDSSTVLRFFDKNLILCNAWFVPLYDVSYLHIRVGSKLVYHRLPWKEPDAPHMIEVLYEDDDMVSVTLCTIFVYLYLFNMVVFMIYYIKYSNQIFETIFFASGAFECK